MRTSKRKAALEGIEKAPTGIPGFDEITLGGLPCGRPTLVCGAAGCGKTLFGVEFLVRGATQYGEPGVFMSFEETKEELAKNVASLGFNLDDLVARKKLYLDYVRIERNEIEETGEYDLEGLFVRLGYAIDSIGAKRVVIDTVEALFAALPNEGILRAELRRLFRWLKDKGVTTVITGERGSGTLTRHGLEEYVADCVILLDHRVEDQISTRRLRIIKYRGSLHGTNEYPFLIDETGISVMPITSISLNHDVSTERVSTGIPRLDTMLGGQGYYRGTSILVSGMAGTGKTTVASHFINASCQRGEKCIYFAFEESPSQIIRNMKSVGIDLGQWVKRGLLRFHATRPTLYGLEMHLAIIHKEVREWQPTVVIVDPVSTFLESASSDSEVKGMLSRLVDFLKGAGITSMYTSLTGGGVAQEQTQIGISSLMDTWLLVRDYESNGERNRGIYVLKSRGMAHSNQVREFRLTDHGVELQDVYTGPSGVLMGAARLTQEARERAEAAAHTDEVARKRRELDRRRQVIESQITALRAQLETETEEAERAVAAAKEAAREIAEDRQDVARLRKADPDSQPTNNGQDRDE